MGAVNDGGPVAAVVVGCQVPHTAHTTTPSCATLTATGAEIDGDGHGRGWRTDRQTGLIPSLEGDMSPLHNTRIIIIKGVFAGSLAVLVFAVFIPLAHGG